MRRGFILGAAALLLVAAFIFLPLWAPRTVSLQITSPDPELPVTFSGSLRDQSGQEILKIDNASTPYATTVDAEVFDGLFVADAADTKLRLQCEIKGLGVTVVRARFEGHGAQVSVSGRSVSVRGA